MKKNLKHENFLEYPAESQQIVRLFVNSVDDNILCFIILTFISEHKDDLLVFSQWHNFKNKLKEDLAKGEV